MAASLGAARWLIAPFAIVIGCGAVRETVELVASGDSDTLRERPDDAPERSPDHPGLLVVAIDGIDRDLLYDMLDEGKMPGLSKLLSGKGAELPHAHLDRTLLSTLPSTTMAAWVTTFTGEKPATHGVPGNEWFVRQERRFVAPVPVTFDDVEPMLESYTEGYTNRAVLVPSVFSQMRARDPNVLIWASMLPYHAGADQLLKADRGVLIDAVRAYVQHEMTEVATDAEAYTVYETVDEETTEAVIEHVEDEDEALADVIAMYYMGADQYAHVSKDGPDRARREYLEKALDPELEKLASALAARNGLANRYVVVLSDHGHTQVVRDEQHALGTEKEGDPPAVLARAGFRVRPFQLEVDEDDDFQAVLAYQGAIAYVYLADRSSCAAPGRACDWKRPPRYRQDVLAAAEAFYAANRDGTRVREMKGTLDMILTRKPKPASEVDAPFEVYVGNGKLVSLRRYLAEHPHPDYVAFDERLRELAVGRAGERAGDVLLLANNGNRSRPGQRYYFSGQYASWHGSPSKKDSEIPLIVAHPGRSRAQLEALVRRAMGPEARQHEIAELLLTLRYGSARAPRRN